MAECCSGRTPASGGSVLWACRGLGADHRPGQGVPGHQRRRLVRPATLAASEAGLFAAMGLLSISPSLAFRRWRRDCRATGALPDASEVRRVRRLVMWQAHLFPIIPVIAVFWARGW